VHRLVPRPCPLATNVVRSGFQRGRLDHQNQIKMEKSTPFPNPFDANAQATMGQASMGQASMGQASMGQASMGPPPSYTAASLIPLSSRMSKSKRYYFVPQNAVSAVLSTGLVVMAHKTQKKSLELFHPPTMELGHFLRTYCPWFVILGPITEEASYVAVNPLRLVEVYADSSKPNTTCVDVEQNVAGRGDHAEGESILQFKVRMPVMEVVARLDPAGYAQMLRDPLLANTDIGFGIRMSQ